MFRVRWWCRQWWFNSWLRRAWAERTCARRGHAPQDGWRQVSRRKYEDGQICSRCWEWLGGNGPKLTLNGWANALFVRADAHRLAR